MSLGRWQVALAMICVISLATGCSTPPKASNAGAGAARPKAEGPPPAAPGAVSSTAPAKPKDILTMLQAAPLKLQGGDKVWVVSAEGYKPRDVRATHIADEALRRVVAERDKATVINGNVPVLAVVLERYQTAALAEIPDEDLIKAARTAGVTKVLVFKATSLAAPAPGAPPFLPPPSGEEPMSVVARVIDVASGKVTAVAEVRTTPAPPVAESEVSTKREYPLRVTDPEYISRPDVQKPKKDSNLLGRRFRAYTRFNDNLGPQGLYDNPGYQEWTRTNDQLGPFPFYSGDATLMMITTTPPSARVFVNGMDTALTPCWLSLEEGDKVVLVKEGFIQEEFRVPADRQAFHIDLRPR